MPRIFNYSRAAPLPLPDESEPLTILHRVKAPLGPHSSITASVCETNTGKGNVKLRKSAKRYATDASPQRAPQKAASSHSRRSEGKIKRHKRRWVFGLNRGDAKVSLSVNMTDTEHGAVKMNLHPSERINIGVHLKRIISLPFNRNNVFLTPQAKASANVLPPCVKSRKSGRTGELLLRHEFEYNWNERRASTLYALEAFQHIISIRVRNNPMRITPKLQAPLCAHGEYAPCLIWEREPKSGPGELQLMRKPFKIAYEFQRRRIRMFHISSGGSISKVSFDAQSVEAEHTVTHILKGAVLTTSSKLSSQPNTSEGSISVCGPWGKIAAHGSPQSPLVLSSDAIFHCSKGRKLRAMIEAQSLSRFAVRLGVFY